MLVSLTVVTWYAFGTIEDFYLKQVRRDLRERLSFIQDHVKDYLDPLNEKDIDMLCKRIGPPSGTRFTVILPSGRVVGDSLADPRLMDNHADRPEIIQAIKNNTGTSVRTSYTLHKKMIYGTVILKDGTEIIGILRAAFPFASIEKQLAEVRKRMVLGSLFVAIFAALISLYMSRRISRPIEKIRKGTERFAEGDFGHRLPVEGAREIRGLAVGMNQMAMELQRRFEVIRQQRIELETILSSMREGILTVDRDEHVVSINEAACMILGVGYEWVRGRSVQEVFRNPVIEQLVGTALATREPLEKDVTIYKMDGDRVMSIYTTPWKKGDRDQSGVLVVLNDVTRIRRLEKIRQEFVANVSHELKTPVTAIKGAVETIRHVRKADISDAPDFIDIISRNAKRLEAIVEDLLTLSRLDQDEMQPRIPVQEVILRHLLLSASSVCKGMAEQRAMRVRLDCPNDLRIKANPHFLEQAVINLLDNAIKYGEREQVITVAAEETDGQIEIRVKDQGPGIEERHLPRLFERFYRVDKARSRVRGGTGLGLAIVKHVARIHGGNVRVISKFGRGSTFIITLPHKKP
ncbi:MAG: hypothetical protein B1H11_01605 [Desulfobacteraceae bacterium 4484_190.1]|nr:MAG: hypothetical protein B1H11_01605 [Desulfobacteraceae bacterium 4484_190.1]